MSKLLVTGCLGFIGSYFCKYAVQTTDDISVIGTGRHSTAKHLKRLEDLLWNPRFTMIYKDIYLDDISELFEGVDYVFNFCAKTFVDHSIIAPEPFVESNIIVTYKLLEMARRYKQIKAFFQISTDEVYGPKMEGSYTEKSPLNPTNIYSATKAAADMLALGYHKTYGVPVIITRTENVYGPYQHPQKVIPAWTKRALDMEPLLIYGDGKHRRMWLHVEDNVRALLHLMEHGKVGEIYHIAGEEELQNIDLAYQILTILGEGISPQLDKVKFIPDKDIRPFHDRRYAIDVSKLKATGWERKYSLEEGLKQTVNWYVKNQWWF